MPNRLMANGPAPERRTAAQAGPDALVLAMDASAGACSVALLSGGATLGYLRRCMTHGHAAVLPPMIRQVIDEAGCRFSSLRIVAATVGPGSFTGVRVALAAARGIALAVGCPCIGVTSLEAIAAAAAHPGRLLVALDTRRGDVYGQVFDAGAAAGAPFVADAATIAAQCGDPVAGIAGDGTSIVTEALAESVERLPIFAPDAVAVGALAARKWAARETGGRELSDRDWPAALPLYLRAPEVSLPPPPVGAPS